MAFHKPLKNGGTIRWIGLVIKMERLDLIVCENYVHDYRQIIKNNGFDFVHVKAFPCLCYQKSKKEQVKNQILANINNKMIICSRTCDLCKMEELKTKDTVFETIKHCFYNYTDEKFIDYIIEKGGYIVTNGWVNHWQERLAQSGFDQLTAQHFFGDFCNEIVLLDIGNDQEVLNNLERLSDYLGLPNRVIQVGMESLNLYLSKVINDWRLSEDHRGQDDSDQAISDLKKQGAEYAAVLDIIEEITGYTKKRDIIQKIKELFQFIFGAQEIRFIEDDEEGGYFKEFISKEFGDSKAEFRIDSEKQDIVVKMIRNQETFGALKIGNFQRPEKVNDYANFALSIARVSALAISNSIQYEQLERSRDEVSYISFHDSLTGIHNRHFYNNYTTKNEIPEKTCVFVCDIDGLKGVNDNYGHTKGDALIISAARVLVKAFRETDVTARVGGDEFYAIMFDCDFEIVKNVKNRIQELIAENNKIITDQALKLSLSIGYFHIDEAKEDPDWEELLVQADQRMYDEKAEKKRLLVKDCEQQILSKKTGKVITQEGSI